MLTWSEVLSIIFYGTLCGVGEILLVEVFLYFKSSSAIKYHCARWSIQVPKDSILYNISINGQISFSPFHPNVISLGRTIGCVIIAPIVSLVNPRLAIYLDIIFYVADYADGRFARKCKLGTELGKKFDPLCDKICYLSQIAYRCLLLSCLFCGLSKWALLLILSETFGQFVIRPILPSLGLGKNVAANKVGKFKALLCFAFVPYFYLVGIDAPIPNWKKEWLITCFILSMLSWGLKLIPDWDRLKGSIPKRWYANLFTTINFSCGIAAFWCVLHDFYAYVMLFILAGQSADAVDGYYAKKYGSPKPWGGLYDDLADFISFGVVVAKMFVRILGDTKFYRAISAIYVFCILFRLIRFLLIDKEIPDDKLDWLEKFSLSSRSFIKEQIGKYPILEKFSFLFFDKEGKERGENIFAGLPSPAAASIVLGATLLLPKYFSVPVVVLTIVLTVSRYHFAHFSRKIFPEMPKTLVGVLGLILVIVVFYTLINGGYIAIAHLSIIYGGGYALYNLLRYNCYCLT